MLYKWQSGGGCHWFAQRSLLAVDECFGAAVDVDYETKIYK
ncbi:hypothetical protein FACS1894126_4630 [Alphaproteobacteria bacterium]|nr:hypothetical protein FACS1894126_4630 [Alphaproteobacteria bacterium]